MRKLFFLFLYVLPFLCFGQTDSLVVLNKEEMKPKHPDESSEMKVFYSQKLINANTVEVLRKGILEFRVSHSFGDIGGIFGGIDQFFGLDNAADVRIGMQLGLTNKLNVILARDKGAYTDNIRQLYELGIKYQLLKQEENSSGHPFSLTVFANSVVSSMKANVLPGRTTSFKNFSDRTSEVVQVMIARKFGKISLQLSPTFVTRGYAIPGDDKSMFAIGAGVRIPLTPKFVFIADYFHSFRSKSSKDVWSNPQLNAAGDSVKFYDALGIGFEILTQGHVFHLNFTNTTELLENRFIPHTVTNWGKGQFRWAFTISRNFTVFRDKKR